MSAGSSDKGLLTPENCIAIFIDHRPEIFFDTPCLTGRELLNNLLVLAKAVRIFNVPVILTTVGSGPFGGHIVPKLLEIFPAQRPIERSSMNAWDSKEVLDAVKRAGRKNLILSALCSEVCLAMPALHALTDGYGVYAVMDASGGASIAAHNATMRRIEQAGGVSTTAVQVLLELQRDWAREAHAEEVMAVLNDHRCSYAVSRCPDQHQPTLGFQGGRHREE
jgi:nicotinamidase-related amidase